MPITPTSSNSIIRAGDTVRLVDPRRIIRIGYEVTAESLLPEVETDPEVLQFCQKQQLTRPSMDRVFRAVATSRMLAQMKTGAVRRVYHSEPFEHHRGNTFRAEEKRIRYSGTFYHGYSGTDYWGEYDYEPAGLDNRTANVCLKLSMGFMELYDSSDEWEGFWVLASQVEKVNPQSAEE